MAKRKLLNVKSHLANSEDALQAFFKYGDCPLVRDWFRQVSLFNRAILRNHEAKKTRKDITL